MVYKQPIVLQKSFTCPHCGTVTQQNWWTSAWNNTEYENTAYNHIRVSSLYSLQWTHIMDNR